MKGTGADGSNNDVHGQEEHDEEGQGEAHNDGGEMTCGGGDEYCENQWWKKTVFGHSVGTVRFSKSEHLLWYRVDLPAVYRHKTVKRERERALFLNSMAYFRQHPLSKQCAFP